MVAQTVTNKGGMVTVQPEFTSVGSSRSALYAVAQDRRKRMERSRQ